MFKASYDEAMTQAEEKSKVDIINSLQNKKQAYAAINTLMNTTNKFVLLPKESLAKWRENEELLRDPYGITEKVKHAINNLVIDGEKFTDLPKYCEEIEYNDYLRSFQFFKIKKNEFILKARIKLHNQLEEVFYLARQSDIKYEAEIAPHKNEIQEALARLKIREEAQKKQETNSLLETNEESYISPASNSVLTQEELLLGDGPYEVDNLEINEI